MNQRVKILKLHQQQIFNRCKALGITRFKLKVNQLEIVTSGFLLV